MAFFLTGGTGKTSRHLATFLQDAKLPFVIGSRRGAAAAPSGLEAVKFDWLDESTFKNPFEHKFPHGEKITAVYLVAPEAEEGIAFMNKFIDYSIKEHGVKRFVLLGGSTAQPGGWYVGKVWQHLLDVGVDYAVLRPSWFMENLSEWWGLEQVKNGQLYTACGNGKIPFISAEDIAAVAFHTLTDEKPHNTSYRILGPELLTYDDVAEKLSNVLGRKIVNLKPSGDDRKKAMTDAGVPEQLADLVVQLELMAARGEEALEGNDVKEVTGRPPISFDEFARKNKSVWE